MYFSKYQKDEANNDISSEKYGCDRPQKRELYIKLSNGGSGSLQEFIVSELSVYHFLIWLNPH